MEEFPELPIQSECYETLRQHIGGKQKKTVWHVLGKSHESEHQLTEVFRTLLELEQRPELKEWMQDQTRQKYGSHSPTFHHMSPTSAAADTMHPISRLLMSFTLDNWSFLCITRVCDKTVCSQPELRRAASNLISAWLARKIKARGTFECVEQIFYFEGDNQSRGEEGGERLSFYLFSNWLTVALTDVWSEIRKETARQWLTLAQSLSVKICEKILANWTNRVMEITEEMKLGDENKLDERNGYSNRSEKEWKVIDGLLRGILSTISGKMSDSFNLNRMQELSQRCLGHSQHSVRNTAILLLDKCAKIGGDTVAGSITECAIRRLMPKNSKTPFDVRICLDQSFWLRNDSLSEGCLGLLSYMLHRLDIATISTEKEKDTFLDSIVQYVDSLDKASGQVSHHTLYQAAVATSALYLCHRASSVRQSASNMVLQASLGRGRDCVQRSIPRLLNVLYVLKGLWEDLKTSSDRSQHWQALEGLMMSYELVLGCLVEDCREAFRPFSRLDCAGELDNVYLNAESERPQEMTYSFEDLVHSSKVETDITCKLTRWQSSHVSPLLFKLVENYREEFTALFESYFWHVCPLITSGIFELKRMAEQLLPVLTELFVWWEDGMDILFNMWNQQINENKETTEWELVVCARTMQLVVNRLVRLEENSNMKLWLTCHANKFNMKFNPPGSLAKSTVWYVVLRAHRVLRKTIQDQLPFKLLLQSTSDRTLLLTLDSLFCLIEHGYIGSCTKQLENLRGETYIKYLILPLEDNSYGEIRSGLLFLLNTVSRICSYSFPCLEEEDVCMKPVNRHPESTSSLSNCASRALSRVCENYPQLTVHGSRSVCDISTEVKQQSRLALSVRSNLISYLEDSLSSLNCSEMTLCIPLLFQLLGVGTGMAEMVDLLRVLESYTANAFECDVSIVMKNDKVSSFLKLHGLSTGQSLPYQWSRQLQNFLHNLLEGEQLRTATKDLHIQCIAVIARIFDVLFSRLGNDDKQLILEVYHLLDQALQPLKHLITHLEQEVGFKLSNDVSASAEVLRTPPKNGVSSTHSVSFPLRVSPKLSHSARDVIHHSDSHVRRGMHKCHSFESQSWKGPQLSELSTRISPEVRRTLFEGTNNDLHLDDAEPGEENGLVSPGDENWSDWDSDSSDWDQDNTQVDPLTPSPNDRRELSALANTVKNWNYRVKRTGTSKSSLKLNDVPTLERLISTIAG